MRVSSFFPTVLALFALGWGPVVAATPEEIGQRIDDFIAAHGLPGAQVGIWRGGSQWAIYEKGLADVEAGTAVSADQYYRIASVTKSFTVTRLLQMAGAGEVDLDQSIAYYLPSVVEGLGNNTATLRQLANMTSGIVNYSATPAMLSQFGANPSATVTDADLVNFAKTETPTVSPGAAWQYSNTNTVLLGMVIESLTGHTLAEELQTHLFTPLGLSHTFFPAPDELDMPFPYAHGYDAANPTAGDDVSNLLSPSWFSGAGAIVSTLGDLRTWGAALASGELLTPEMQAQRLQLVDAGQDPDGPYYDAYGLGIGSIDGWLGHTGERPGYQDLVMVDPETGFNIVITLNSGFGSPNLATELFLELNPMLVPEPSAFALGLSSLALMAWAARRRRTTC